jgi:hypothetical protein
MFIVHATGQNVDDQFPNRKFCIFANIDKIGIPDLPSYNDRAMWLRDFLTSVIWTTRHPAY